MLWASMPTFMAGIHDFICPQTASIAFSAARPRESGDPGSDEGLYILLWIPACAGMGGEWDRAQEQTPLVPAKAGTQRGIQAPRRPLRIVLDSRLRGNERRMGARTNKTRSSPRKRGPKE